MKSKFFKILSIAIIAAFLVPAFAYSQAGKTSFVGNWTFNQSKSDMGQPMGGPGGGQGGGPRMGGNLTVKQEANLLTVDRTRTNQDGQTVTTTEKYTLDGKECVNTTGRGEAKSTVTWAADGKTLTINTTRTFNMNGETREMKSKSVWALTDANTLTVTSTMSTPNGERVTRMVYDKK